MQKKTVNPKQNIVKKDKDVKPVYKLPEDMENEIRDAFNFYDTEKTGSINRGQLRSLMGNFAFTNQNVKEIEEEIKAEFQTNLQKNSFTYDDAINLISKKWFHGNGRENEANEIYKLFDRKGRGVGLLEVKHLFSQYLDIVISDADIQEFITEADQDQDGVLNRQEFCQKLGYM